MNHPQPPSDRGANASAGAGTVRESSERSVLMRGNRLESTDLFANARELMIAHGEDVYRLRLTAQNKLILTK